MVTAGLHPHTNAHTLVCKTQTLASGHMTHKKCKETHIPAAECKLEEGNTRMCGDVVHA